MARRTPVADLTAEASRQPTTRPTASGTDAELVIAAEEEVNVMGAVVQLRPAPTVEHSEPIQIPRKAKAKRTPTVVVKENFWRLVESFERHLRAENAAPDTVRIRRKSFEDFARYLEREGISLHIEAITREHIRGYLAEITGARGLAAGTARIRHTSLHCFFGWLRDEGEIDVNPMTRVARPKVEETPPEVMSDGHLVALLRACKGRDFLARRDTALIRVMLDTGLRRGELASIRMDALDLKKGEAWITGKTGKRLLAFSTKTVEALDRYTRVREDHLYAHLPNLWISHRGAITGPGIYHIIHGRAAQAGIDRKIWPHLFRHTFAHVMKAAGASDEVLMEIGGWKSHDMLRRYGKSAAHERAMDAHRALGLGNRV